MRASYAERITVCDPIGHREGDRNGGQRQKGCFLFLIEITMSNHHQSYYLPPEIVDCITDLLYDNPKAINQCCLVSKSWVPRTRKHLFADVKFSTVRDLEAWKKTFPDPANSPAYYTRTLTVCCAHAVKTADAEEGGWIRAFSRVVQLEVWSCVESLDGLEVSLIPFHNFSPVLKSLRVDSIATSHSQSFNLICSLPLLEDMCLVDHRNYKSGHVGTVFQPSTSPVLTGTLNLYLEYGMKQAARRLLALPNGLHFRKLVCTWLHGEDIPWTAALVAGCYETLECVDIDCWLDCRFL